MEEKEFPWPEKGDQLFTSGEDWWLSSYIESWNKDFHAYAEGYKQAADIITAEVTGTEEKFLKSTRDYVVYPVVFLYRHYVELRLKEIILIGRKLYDMSQGLPKHHKIEELWKHARGILSHTSSKNDLDVAEGCIIEFAKMDPTSESFRYPINREGKRSIEQDRLVISLRHLQEVMGRLGSFLDSSSEYMVILYDEKREFEDEY